jgi:hypothetical protein
VAHAPFQTGPIARAALLVPVALLAPVALVLAGCAETPPAVSRYERVGAVGALAGNQGASSEVIFHTPEIALVAGDGWELSRRDAFAAPSSRFELAAWPDDGVPRLEDARRFYTRERPDQYIYFRRAR